MGPLPGVVGSGAADVGMHSDPLRTRTCPDSNRRAIGAVRGSYAAVFLARAPGALGTAGFERELAFGRGLLGDHAGARMDHEQPPIEQFPDLHARLVPGALMGARWELHPAAGDRDGIVTRHHACIAAREHTVEVARRGAERAGVLARRASPALIVTLDELRQIAHRPREV